MGGVQGRGRSGGTGLQVTGLAGGIGDTRNRNDKKVDLNGPSGGSFLIKKQLVLGVGECWMVEPLIFLDTQWVLQGSSSCSGVFSRFLGCTLLAWRGCFPGLSGTANPRSGFRVEGLSASDVRASLSGHLGGRAFGGTLVIGGRLRNWKTGDHLCYVRSFLLLVAMASNLLAMAST